MKKMYSLLGILFFAANVFAQNVGINNTNPAVSLDVQGALRNRPTSFNIATTPIVVTSNIGFVILTGTNTSSPTLTVTGGADGTRILVKNTTNQSCKFPAASKDVPINTLVEYIYADGTWQWIASSIVNTTWEIKGNLFIDSTTDFIGTLSNQPIVFKTGNIERMKLNSNGTFSTQGNVGIGIATPNARLVVNKSIKSTLKVSTNDYVDTTQLIFSNKNGNIGTDMLISSNQEQGLRFSSSSDVGTQTKDTIMQITPQGNVGIRTATPAYPLDVKGNVGVTGEIKPNGTSGVAGTVLTSNGNGTMQWTEAKTNGSVGFGPWGDCSTNAISEYNPVADATGAASGCFGSSVSISGNYAIVGAPCEEVGVNFQQGSVSIYQFIGGSWVFMQKITDATGAAGDDFGVSVFISGNYAIVGAAYDDVGANTNQGSANIYQLSGGSWVLMQKITDATGTTDDLFGRSVSISGNYAIVGAPSDDVGANTDQGSAIIYQFTGGSWVLMQKITDVTGAASDDFGHSVSISGNYAIVGAQHDNVGANTEQGSAIIYQFTGGSWVLMQKITDATGTAYNLFGHSVSISGNYAIVGAYSDDVGANLDQGSVSIYQLSGGTWVLMKKITDATGATGDRFGSSVSISGNYAIVGADGDNVGANGDQGSASIYQRIGLGWQKVQYVTDPGGNTADYFGRTVGFDAVSKRFIIAATGYASFNGKVVFGKLNF
jgi:hypothetical protein